MPGYDHNPGFPSFNREKARHLVDAYKADHGGAFNVVLASVNDPETSLEVQLVQQQLSKAGIAASVEVQDQTAFINVALAGQFNALVFRGFFGDDPDAQYVFWTKGSPFNLGRVDDPELQQLLDTGRETPDPVQRAEIYRQVNARFAREFYNVWAWYVDWTIASKPNVEGLAGTALPDGGGNAAFLGFTPLIGIWLAK